MERDTSVASFIYKETNEDRIKWIMANEDIISKHKISPVVLGGAFSGLLESVSEISQKLLQLIAKREELRAINSSSVLNKTAIGDTLINHISLRMLAAIQGNETSGVPNELMEVLELQLNINKKSHLLNKTDFQLKRKAIDIGVQLYEQSRAAGEEVELPSLRILAKSLNIRDHTKLHRIFADNNDPAVESFIRSKEHSNMEEIQNNQYVVSISLGYKDYVEYEIYKKSFED